MPWLKLLFFLYSDIVNRPQHLRLHPCLPFNIFKFSTSVPSSFRLSTLNPSWIIRHVFGLPVDLSFYPFSISKSSCNLLKFTLFLVTSFVRLFLVGIGFPVMFLPDIISVHGF